MKNNIYALTLSVINLLDGGWIFLIALFLELSLFVIVTLLAVFLRFYSMKKRAWYFSCSFATLAIELAFLSLENLLSLFYFSLGLTLLFWSAVFIIPERKGSSTKRQRELARMFDKKAQSQTLKEEPKEFSEEEQAPPLSSLEKLDDEARFELDFQHVKLVIQKLEYYPVSASDKKIIKELEDNIYNAENQGFTSTLKSKINDGLGALLKIMSKYGV